MHSGNPGNPAKPLNRQRLTKFMHSESKEWVVPPVLAPGASADGGAARARVQDTCCAARARSRNECGWGSSVRQSHPYKVFSLIGLTQSKSRDTTQRFLPFHPASGIARRSRSTRAALAHTPVSAARLGGGGGVGSGPRDSVRVRASTLSRGSPKSRCCYYSALYSAICDRNHYIIPHSAVCDSALYPVVCDIKHYNAF